MTANHGIDPAPFLSEHLERAEPDLWRSMLKTFIDAPMGAETDAICGPCARRTPRIGSTPATITCPGSGTPYRDHGSGNSQAARRVLLPRRLLERRRRAGRTRTTVVATSYLLRVSSRRFEKLVETLGITRLSKSQVSVMAKELDEHVADFRSGPLDAGPYATDWMTGGSRACAQNPDYATVRDRLDAGWETGDPPRPEPPSSPSWRPNNHPYASSSVGHSRQ
jgi:putative transposase